jgi:hypothetical protein
MYSYRSVHVYVHVCFFNTGIWLKICINCIYVYIYMCIYGYVDAYYESTSCWAYKGNKLQCKHQTCVSMVMRCMYTALLFRGVVYMYFYQDWFMYESYIHVESDGWQASKSSSLRTLWWRDACMLSRPSLAAELWGFLDTSTVELTCKTRARSSTIRSACCYLSWSRNGDLCIWYQLCLYMKGVYTVSIWYVCTKCEYTSLYIRVYV